MLHRLPNLATVFIAITLCSLGCQNVLKGPGVLVTVRAEPKTGYVPPDDPDQPYGPTDSAPAQPPSPAFHRIDYHRLDGVLVFIEPLDDGGRSSAAGVAPMSATVDIDAVRPARAEDFQVASVGGRVVVNGPPPRSGKGYIIRTEAGTLSEVSPGGAGYVATAPGLVEILSDDADVPLATAYVAPTSWARKVGQGQRVAFPLPPGRYRVTVWQPILPGGSQDIEIAPGQQQMSPVTLTVGVNSLPKAR